MWLNNAHIAPYQFARDGGHDPERPGKLLLHRREIDRLNGKVREAGLTLVPLSVYLTGGHAKVELALAKGRRTVDKRERIKEREQRRRWTERGGVDIPGRTSPAPPANRLVRPPPTDTGPAPSWALNSRPRVPLNFIESRRMPARQTGRGNAGTLGLYPWFT